VEALLQKEIEAEAAGEADAMEEVLENFDVDEDF
jgi:hypothetical protein